MKEMRKNNRSENKKDQNKHTVLDMRSLSRLSEKTTVLKAQRGVALL